ncbi:MAG: helix-turn-helix transcriptional regulator [Actinomycetes bacterium]
MHSARAQRERLGFSQAHTAFLLGTRQSNVSAYESGTLEAGHIVTARLDALNALEVNTAHCGTWAGTVPSHAIELARSIKPLGGIERDLAVIREIIAMNDAFNALEAEADRALFLTQPTPTGYTDIDSLLAGLTVHWCRMTRMTRVPAWIRDRRLYLVSPWWVGNGSNAPKARSRALANGIPALRARGIFLDRATLQSV